MNTTKIKNTIKSLGAASAIAFGIVMFAGADANAQNRQRQIEDYQQQQNGTYNDRENGQYQDRNRNNGQQMREAMQRGYLDGLRQGIQAARQNRRGGNGNNAGYYGNNGSYNGNNGMHNGNGRNGGRLQQAYRNGFDRGYREGLRRAQNNRNGSRFPF